ncbi:hypothetical protein GIB67_027689 [Kingdonia uniflora]|uniref:Uncharacterized protein n=1 Tax=Kingdonia uniflora TaxID=39325 RepID=A0A7J7NKX7_9MAGN|nr:hypothetical protein GIB67_027689 [Kingdonia uniflora]
MASIFGCVKADKADLIRQLTAVIGVGDDGDTVVELIEWPRLKGSLVEYPTSSSWFWEFCKAKSSIDGIWGHAFAYRAQFDYWLTLPLSNLAKSVMNWIGACPAQLNCNFWEVILVCETLNIRWAASGSERRITAKDFLEYYAVKYVTTIDGRVRNDSLLWVSGEYLQRSDEEPLKLNNRTITKARINYKVSRKESVIDVVTRKGTELEAVLKELEISRFKRVASKDDKVRRLQAKRRLAGKTPSSMEEKLSTPKLNTPLKLARLNEIPDGPVDVATVSSTAIRNLAKRKAIKRGAAPRSVTSVSVDDCSNRRKVTSPIKSLEVLEKNDKIVEGANLRPRFEVEAGLLEEQCRAKAREKMVAIMDDEFKEFARALRDVQHGFQDRPMKLERRISQLEGEKNQLEEILIQERGAFQLEREKEREAAALKLKEVRAKSEAEAERFVTAPTISRNNLTGKLYQLRYTKAEIMAFREGNYEEMEIMDEEEVEKREDGLNVAEKTAADNQETTNQNELDVAREREEQTLLYNAEYAEEYEVLFSQYEDRLDDNVKLSLKLEKAKRQVEQKIATILSKDLALNQLTNELAELMEKDASGSCIMGKDQELRNSAQIHDSLIAMLDRVKADLRCLKWREAQSRADLVEIQAKNKSLVDDLAHAHRNMRRVVQREKEMNERINQLCARISESERELRVREMKYQKDLKFKLDKRDGEIASGEGSREMKEFLCRKEELVENMRIDLTNSWQKLIDLTRQMSERIDQLTTELAESKARRLKDNKRDAVTHQTFKEIAVHEQEKCDGEALHQRQLNALVAFFVREIKFLLVEKDFMQDCFSGRTCVCKLNISSIDPIGVMDRWDHDG